MKLKIGDRIKNVDPGSMNYRKFGKVVDIHTSWTYVRYEDGRYGSTFEPELDYKKVRKPNKK